MQKRSNRRRIHSAIGIGIEAVERRLLMSTYTVNTLSDAVNPGTGLLSFRQAVADANAHAGNDTIAFSSTVFAAGSLHTISLTQGEIDFTDFTGTTFITAPGPTVLAINAHGASRVFNVGADANVSITGLTITGGFNSGYDAHGNTSGGAIISTGTSLTLNNCVVSNNQVAADGDTYSNLMYQTFTAGTGSGGAIYASGGTLTITNSTLSGDSVTNSAGSQPDNSEPGGSSFGGAIFSVGPLTLTNDILSGNSAAGFNQASSAGPVNGGSAGGGAVYATGLVTISSSTITDNSAIGGNGYFQGGSNGGNGSGGGIWTGPGALTISNSSVTDNTATGGAPDYFDDLGAPTGVAGFGAGGGIFTEAPLSVTSSHVDGNIATEFFGSSGGGIYSTDSASIANSTVDNNHGTGTGGGLFIDGQLVLQNSTVSGNVLTEPQVPSNGFQSPTGAGGGGVYIDGNGTINSSTISGNSVKGGHGYYDNPYVPAPGGNVRGGGVYAEATLTITNSTIVQNLLTGGVGGQGTFEDPGATGGNASGAAIFSTNSLKMFDSTVTGNSATAGAGGVAGVNSDYPAGMSGTATAGGIDIASGTAALINSIVAGDKAGGQFSDITGKATGGANDFVGVGGGLLNGVDGDIVGNNNPGLSPLGNNGGPTQTQVPLSGSPVIDKGNNSLIPTGVTTDQRGFPRLQGTTVDIGATELGTSTITGLVFNDWFATGLKDHSVDQGLAGWTVYLDLNHNGQLDSSDISAVTNSSGNYTFTGIPLGTYTINIVGQKNFRSSNAASVTVKVGTYTTTTAPSFAETGDALLTGTVVDSVTKKGLAGWRVYIDLKNSGKYVTTDPSVTTASDGSWSISTPLIGTYTVRVVPETGYSLATPAAGDFVFTIGKGSARVGNVFSETKL